MATGRHHGVGRRPGSLAACSLAAEARVAHPGVDVGAGLARLHVAEAALVRYVAHGRVVAGLRAVSRVALPGLEAVDPATINKQTVISKV